MSDRTQELLSLVQNISANTGKKQPFQRNQEKGKNAFNEAAADIARGVSKTSSMLAKLTGLVRNQGLFDDPTEEINTLIFKIKQDLDDLNSKCESAQQFIDSKKSIFGDNSTQSSQHNNKVVSQLKSDLMTTTKDFKGILELRTNKMKDQQQRKVELVGKSLLSPTRIIEDTSKQAPSSSANQSFLDSNASQALTRRHKKSLPNPYANPYESRANQDDISQLEENRAQTQHLLLEPLNAENQYYDAREQAVSEVEKTIGELGQLFKRLSTMIQAQQELVERIDEDVENAVANTENAKNALLKAYETASSNRGMIMKIGGILVLFFLIFVLFMM
jgi:syntaxin 5